MSFHKKVYSFFPVISKDDFCYMITYRSPLNIIIKKKKGITFRMIHYQLPQLIDYQFIREMSSRQHIILLEG